MKEKSNMKKREFLIIGRFFKILYKKKIITLIIHIYNYIYL